MRTTIATVAATASANTTTAEITITAIIHAANFFFPRFVAWGVLEPVGSNVVSVGKLLAVGVLDGVISVVDGMLDDVISVVEGRLDDVISGVLISVTVGVLVLLVAGGVPVGSG